MSDNTTRQTSHRDVPEVIFYIACWVFVLATPLFEEAYDHATGMSEQFDWYSLGLDYLAFVPFAIIFLLCKLVYEPFLFFRGRITAFVIAAVLTAFVSTLAFSYLAPDKRHRRIRQQMLHEQQFEAQAAVAADSLPFPAAVPDSPFPPRLSPKGPHHPHGPHPLPERLANEKNPGRHHGLPLLRGPFLPMLLMSLMMIGASLGVSMVFQHRREQLDRKERQAARLQSELDYLKYQINPHFFMNTLNNIHALVDIDSELAKGAIIELSRMMRYLLYESNQPTVPMRKELTFVKHYLELMKLRCDESVTLTYQEPSADCRSLDAGVPPMLLISFIENAFKHGISHREPSYIDISIQHEDDRFHFHCANSNFCSEANAQQQGGVGLDNVRKRLELIYPGRHTLDIHSTDREFSVDFWLPVGQ